MWVECVGKIFDVFLGRGIRGYRRTKNNAEGMAKTLEALGAVDSGLIFVNLVDFDQLYGHRNDVEGYGAALEQFDAWLPDFEARAPARRPGRFSPPITAATRPSRAPITRANTCPSGLRAESAPGVALGLRGIAFRYRSDRGREFRRIHRHMAIAF